MIKKEIEVGKYTLESLTTGMYSDPKIIYREYIQNAVDSLDEAVSKKIVDKQYSRIDIIISNETNYISIKDNGMGISVEDAYKTLTDIGNSKKVHSSNRGFRGIGRLGGLSYCKKLSFTTSYIDENKKTIITFDCEKLRKLLVPGEYEGYDINKVIEEVVTYKIENEGIEEHYFLTELIGIDSFSDLLDLERIESYISQVAPLPYFPRLFVWGTEIKNHLKTIGHSIEEFPIFLGDSFSSLKPVYKPCRHRFEADRKKTASDEINQLKFFEIYDDNSKQLLASGWYAETNLYGTILDSKISGLRLRKGNILIGDSKTLNNIFKEERFNSWVQGEIFAFSPYLIPNARRDNFEQNDTFHVFIEKLETTVGEEISRKIREASRNRNDPNNKAISEVEIELKKINSITKNGFNSKPEKDTLVKDLNGSLDKIEKIRTNQEEVNNKKIKLKEDIEKKIAQIQDDDNYKLKRVNSSVGKKERKVLEIVSEVLTRHLSKPLLDLIMDELITEINKHN